MDDPSPGALDFTTFPADGPLRVITGAGTQRWEGWIPARREQLELRNPRSWARRSGIAKRTRCCANTSGST